MASTVVSWRRNHYNMKKAISFYLLCCLSTILIFKKSYKQCKKCVKCFRTMKVQFFVLLFLFSFSIRSVFGQEYIFEYKDFFDLMEQIDRLHPPCTPKLRYKKYINRCIEKRTHIRKRQISETDANKLFVAIPYIYYCIREFLSSMTVLRGSCIPRISLIIQVLLF